MATQEEIGTGLHFPSLRFFEAIRDALNNDPEFARATRLFDGSMLLNIGEQSIWMKWYRGEVMGGDIVAATRVQEATFIMAGHIHDIGNGGAA
jgi:hypothetical protein